MKEILYISRKIPYASIGDAGGKTLYYYINTVCHSQKFKVSILNYSTDNEVARLQCVQNGIKVIQVPNENKKMTDIFLKLNFFDKYARMIGHDTARAVSKALLQLKESGYLPDIIVLEWTQTVLLIDIVKEIYPSTKIVASEHDVSFLGFQRRISQERNLLKKAFRLMDFINLKHRECNALSKCEKVYTHNKKDMDLLLQNRINKEKLEYLIPYYDVYKGVAVSECATDLVFFGAMARQENFLSAIWFIENVMPLISDLGLRFVVIGSNPPDVLKKYESDNIVITGFVPDLKSTVSNALIGVVPLQLGAGIKVKVLEFCASGIPVITNAIGIEGIPLEKGLSYLHCETAEEYADIIKRICKKEIDIKKIASSAKESIAREFPLEESGRAYVKNLISL